MYMFGKMMTASKFAASNMTPRANLERLGPSLPKATADMLWRARGCHLNALEGFPLFAAAMVRQAPERGNCQLLESIPFCIVFVSNVGSVFAPRYKVVLFHLDYHPH